MPKVVSDGHVLGGRQSETTFDIFSNLSAGHCRSHGGNIPPRDRTAMRAFSTTCQSAISFVAATWKSQTAQDFRMNPPARLHTVVQPLRPLSAVAITRLRIC
jgi:hypothetical protein